MSRPTRARGLKLQQRFAEIKHGMVAPHAGAWIETRYVPPSATALIVAPHAGAWIETYNIIYENSNIKVAPHAGAWIETS